MKFENFELGKTYWRVSYKRLPGGAQSVAVTPVEVSAISHENKAVFAQAPGEKARWCFEGVYCKWRQNEPEVVLEEDGRVRLRNLEERFGGKS